MAHRSPASTATAFSTGNADGLSRAAPSTVGVDADAIVGFLNDVEAAGLDLHALMLHRHGQVIAETWRWPYRADRPRNLHSVAKSFTACGIALALEEGRFRLDDKVVSFFPEALPAQVDARLAAMSVEDLLTMRTGHGGQTSGAIWRDIGSSWIAEFFKIPLVHQPGTIFVYTSAASYMLSAILSRITGQTLHDYLRPRILEPLGIQGETWSIGPDGVNPGGNGLVAQTVDMLKLGILHAQQGVWEGKQLLPKHWIETATRPHVESERYGYHWWTHSGGHYSAIGVFVQMVSIFPLHGVTLAVTGAIKGSAQLMPHIERHFPAAFDSAHASSAADDRLARKLVEWRGDDAPTLWNLPYAPRTIRSDGPAGSPKHPLAALHQVRFAMQANPQHIAELEVVFTAATCTFRLIDADGAHEIVAGFGDWHESRTDMTGSHLHHGYRLRNGAVLARAAWLDDKRLHMTWIFPETAFRDTVVCEFDDAQVTVHREVNINGGTLRDDPLLGTRIDPA